MEKNMPVIKLLPLLVCLSVNILSSQHLTDASVVCCERRDVLSALGSTLTVNDRESSEYKSSGDGFEISWNGASRGYDGRLEVKAANGELLCVNEVELADYLASVVGAEMVPGAGLEALKAQAVLARTFVETAHRHEDKSWDFCDLTHCQSYKGLESATPSSRKAVDETEGLHLLFKGQPCEVYYHSTSGGRTANISNIWPDVNHDYLISVADPYSSQSPHHSWTYVVSASDLARSLGFCDIGDVRVIERSSDERVKLIALKVGEEGILMGGWEFRMQVCQALGWNTVKSSWFEVERDAGAYVFSGFGLGHGVGLSQWGAKGMADEGKDFREILAHYYPGTKVIIWQ
ncbi:SpoIID/LytB domain-containing protein [candidate division WOR-3 bacterium]|uniref:SpoIID/LytB domain-containing protein n=1 Tax=candidate division WOR-3 bacterium TaxID=2052148 RepID=A0A9D5K7I1_UNCW3|nr:SpoIID/LytB domain-containing protein [candidate division WOR-3 bacterium]MBD3363697.1 SpoIID/LytB domain-containing protein [candidate division WOR-3 bacterium]